MSDTTLICKKIERDNRIDTIRGLLLIFMAIDHFGGWITNYTWQFYGYSSDAEGFVFLSGFIFALVYGRHASDLKGLTKKIFGRAFTVYKYHLSLVIFLPLLALLIPFYRYNWQNMLEYFFINGTPLKYIFSSSILLNQPTYMDVLPMYTVFILLSLPLILLFKKGYASLALIICGSVWIIGQFINPISFLSDYFFHNSYPGLFNIFSWQLIFFVGAFLGFYKKIGKSIRVLSNRYVMILVCTLYVIILLSRYQFINLGFDINAATERSNLAWLRLVSFFSFAFVLSTILKTLPLSAKLPGIDFLGKHSLQVFSFHIAVLYFIIVPLGAGIGIYEGYGKIAYLSVLVIFILTLFIPAYIHSSIFVQLKKVKRNANERIACN